MRLLRRLLGRGAARAAEGRVVLILHEPSQRFVGMGFVLTEASEALRFADSATAQEVLDRWACSPCFALAFIREATVELHEAA